MRTRKQQQPSDNRSPNGAARRSGPTLGLRGISPESVSQNAHRKGQNSLLCARISQLRPDRKYCSVYSRMHQCPVMCTAVVTRTGKPFTSHRGELVIRMLHSHGRSNQARANGTKSDGTKATTPFIVGNRYLDRHSVYTVIAVQGNENVFQREDGMQSTGDVAMKTRIHRNILFDRPAGDSPSSRHRRISLLDNGRVGFVQDEVFPIIAAVIESHSKAAQTYATHHEIVEALLEDSDFRPMLDRLAHRDPKGRSASWWASNMVAFFSQAITLDRSEWKHRLERERIDGRWAYRSRRT